MSNNPFVAAKHQLESTLFVQGGNSYQEWLISLQLLISLSLLFIIIAVVVRIRRAGMASVWIFRKEKGFIVPNGVWASLLFQFLYIIIDIFYIESSKFYGRSDSNISTLNGAIFFRTAVWIPLLCAAWSVAWSASIQTLKLNTSDSYGTGLRKPIYFNLFFGFFPISLIGIMLGLAGVAENHWNKILHWCVLLDEGLILAIAQYDTNGQITNLAELLQLENLISMETPVLVFYWRLAIIVLAVSLFMVIVITLIASTNNFLDLRRTMQQLSDRQGGNDAQVRALRFSYSSILLSTFAVLILELLYLAEAITLAAETTKFTTDPAAGALLTVSAIAIYALAGLLVNLGFLIRSFQVVKAPNNLSNSSFSKGLFNRSSSGGMMNTFDKKLDGNYTEYVKADRKFDKFDSVEYLE